MDTLSYLETHLKRDSVIIDGLMWSNNKEKYTCHIDVPEVGRSYIACKTLAELEMEIIRQIHGYVSDVA